MKSKKSTSFLILCYIIVTYVISGIGYFLWFQAENYESPAALITILGPLTGSFILVSMLIFMITGHRFHSFSITSEVVISGLIQWILGGFCEEIGWRCVFLPLLKEKLKVQYASIITGVIWTGWHVPLIIRGLMVMQFTKGIAILMFLIELIAISLILGVISEIKSVDNIWTYMSYHAVHNFSYIFLIKAINENDYFLINDGGYIVVSVLVLFALIINFVYLKKHKTGNRKSDILQITL